MKKINIDWHTGRRPMRVDVKTLLYEKIEIKEGNGSQYQEIIAQLFSGSYAKGTFPIYIIATPSQDIHIGNDQLLYLKPASAQEIRNFFHPLNEKEAREISRILGNILSEQGRNISGNESEKLAELINLHQQSSVFYIPTLPIPKEDLINRKDLPELIEAALTDGCEKDWHIIYISKILLPTVMGDITILSPEEVMYAAPHMIVITNSKTGKTTTFGKVGYIEERPTPAHLLGFSTAKDKVTGGIHQRTKATIVDGVEELAEDEEVARGFLNLMERGRAKVSRGKGIVVITYSTIVFTSNPIIEEGQSSPSDRNIYALNDFLKMIHRNAGAIGSRIGVFVFDMGMQRVTKSGQFDRETQRELKKLVASLQQVLKISFTALLHHPKIDKWLKDEDEKIKRYKKELEEIASTLTNFPIVEQFIKGHMDAYSHIKGAAMRAAFMDFVPDMIKIEKMEDLSDALVEKVLEKAEIHLEIILQMNLDSFRRLTGLTQDKKIMDKLMELRLENFERRATVYEKLLMRCMMKWFLQQNKGEVKWIVNLSSLKDSFLKIPLKERQNSPYGSFNSLCNAIEKNMDKINNKSRLLGIYLKRINGSIVIHIEQNHYWIVELAKYYGLIKDKKEYQFHQFYQSDDEEIGNIGNIGNKNSSMKNGEENENGFDLF